MDILLGHIVHKAMDLPHQQSGVSLPNGRWVVLLNHQVCALRIEGFFSLYRNHIHIISIFG